MWSHERKEGLQSKGESPAWQRLFTGEPPLNLHFNLNSYMIPIRVRDDGLTVNLICMLAMQNELKTKIVWRQTYKSVGHRKR